MTAIESTTNVAPPPPLLLTSFYQLTPFPPPPSPLLSLATAIESTTNVASVITQGVSATPTALAAHPFEPHTVVTADSEGMLKVGMGRDGMGWDNR